MVFAFDTSGRKAFRVFDAEYLVGPGISLEIGKGAVDVNAVTGWDDMHVSVEGLMIPYGSACPLAWGFSKGVVLEPEDDFLLVNEPLHRLYVGLTVDLVGVGKDFPYALVLSGNVCGYSLPELSPMQGRFACVMDSRHVSEPQSYSLAVPRQLDSSMKLGLYKDHLLMYYESTKASSDFKPACEIPLGEVLAGYGYDWNGDGLPDIRLLVDAGNRMARVSVGDWCRELEMVWNY